jgi:hypothetical protein
MNPKLLAPFLLLLVSQSYAQDATTAKTTDRNYRYWAVKLPVANVVDFFSSPNLQLGVEDRIDKYNGIQFIAGISIDNAIYSSANETGARINGFRIKGEYRRYFRFRKSSCLYGAAELFYTQYYNDVETNFIRPDSTIYTDAYRINTQKYGINFKLGFHKTFKKRFMFDVFAGLGLEDFITTEKGRLNPDDKRYHFPVHELHFNYDPPTGDRYTGAMPINFVLGYMIR